MKFIYFGRAFLSRFMASFSVICILASIALGFYFTFMIGVTFYKEKDIVFELVQTELMYLRYMGYLFCISLFTYVIFSFFDSKIKLMPHEDIVELQFETGEVAMRELLVFYKKYNCLPLNVYKRIVHKHAEADIELLMKRFNID